MKGKRRFSGILMTCAGGDAVRYLALRLKGRYRVLLADAADHSEIAGHCGLPFARIPRGDDPGYASRVGELVAGHGVDLVVPGADEEILPLLRASEKGVLPPVLAPASGFSRLALDKRETARLLFRKGLSALPVFRDIRDVAFPAVVKPRHGRGSREVHAVAGMAQLRGYLKLYRRRFDEVAAEPDIGGAEYTVSVVVNNRNRLIGVVPKRVISKRGVTRIAVSEAAPAVAKACAGIVAELRPCGPFNVQLKLHEGRVHVFEINPRLSTTAVLTERCFGNEVELFMKYWDADEIRDPPALRSGIYLYRYDRDYFKADGAELEAGG